MNAPREPEALAAAAAARAGPSRYSIALNALPFVYLLCGAGAVALTHGAAAGAALALAWLYLLPPLAVRVACALFGSPVGTALDQESRAYKVWWFATQMQVIFNRFGAFEECLRMVPGLYPLWLRLWGARTSFEVYWASGAMLVDRTLLRVGAGVVVGTRAVLAAHLAYKDEAGAFRVTVAPIEIGNDVLIGAYAGVGPGCRIEDGAEVPAAAFLRPHTHWSRKSRARSGRPRTH